MKHESKDPQNFFQELQVEFLIHELKDPISVIETGMRTLLEKREKYGALSPRQEKTLKRNLRNAQKARTMLYNLLEIGRSEAGCFTCCCFRPAKAAYETLMDSLEVMAGKLYEQCGECQDEEAVAAFLSQHGIFLDIPPPLMQLEMEQDESKFRQIVGNLIKNALHHRREQVDIRVQEEKNHLLVDVADDGPGIAAEHHQAIFQRYAQVGNGECTMLPRKGHGLGLAGALILAQCLGGDIQVRSQRGKGAKFRLTLPIRFIGD
ncbi:MAG: hypothetical protein B6245_23530 [Desulfobacteraceae bacterium 4572_88]|nr:MAG: hypothetical protein B6245_23530 [Desulfobacteraceae bacterium 4572_88]